MTRGRIWNDDDSASVRNLLALGRTDTEIARILGFSRETIVRRRQLQGLRALQTVEARQIAKLRGRVASLVARKW